MISNIRTRSGPAISTVPLTGADSATSAIAATTSSDAIGCISAVDRWIASPCAEDLTMPPMNSKNCVECTMV